MAMYLEDLMSVSLNLAGVPGLAIPVGETKEGLSLGLQLVGPRRSDQALLRFAKQIASEGEPEEDHHIDIMGGND